MFFSVAIPAYEANGKGVEFLKFSLNILENQSFRDFEIVVSDNSLDDKIQELCRIYSQKLNINYFKNPNRSMSGNLNNTIKKCKGDFIKILFQDDFLYSKDSLSDIYKEIDRDTYWLVTGTEHLDDKNYRYIRPFYPTYNSNILLGNNTISCPSVLTIKNTEDIMMFDENLTWLMDVDYYERLYRKFGLPKILNKINVVNRLSQEQSSSIISQEIKNKETEYILTKYNINLII